MTITTYSELQTAVADWLHREDLLNAGKIVDFITIAEANINDYLRSQPGETETNLTATPSSRFIALPSNYVSPIALWLTQWTPRDKLIYVTPAELPVDDTNSTPTYWAIDGTNIALDVPADIAYTFKFRYKSKYKLTDAAPTNWLLTNHPNVYLYGALSVGSRYVRDYDAVTMWDDMYRLSIAEARSKELKANALSDLRVDPALSGIDSNILRGD